MQMMASEELGIPLNDLKPIIGDTESIPYNQSTGGSRTTFATGMAVIEAAQDVVQQLKERAASLWNVTPDQVEWRDGSAINTAGEGQMTCAEIAPNVRRLVDRYLAQAMLMHGVQVRVLLSMFATRKWTWRQVK